MRKWILVFGLFLFYLSGMAHPWMAENFVIIDTDGGLDDFKAINLMLASSDTRVIAITTSDGVLDAEEAYKKVKSLLNDLHHEGILAGVYADEKIEGKNCEGAISYAWGEKTSVIDSFPDAKKIIEQTLMHKKEPITFVSLGSLALAADGYKSIPDFRSKIKQVIWAGDKELDDENFNYALSPSSFKIIQDQSELPFVWIDAGSPNLVYQDNLAQEISGIQNVYANKINDCIENSVSEFGKKIFDEMVPLYMQHPDLFDSETREGISCSTLKKNIDISSHYIESLIGQSEAKNKVMKCFPSDSSYYQVDVAKIMEPTIYKFGKEEWDAGVLANEMHRHLGVYAIIGVKMGIRAREYFGAGIDESKILSYAGLTPPFSCMNDGLQVSTGATLGHGLIKISPDDTRLPKAEFEYMGRRICLTLKDEYRVKNESQIKELQAIYSLNSDIYWDLVREKALNYWLNWDRHEIFELEVF